MANYRQIQRLPQRIKQLVQVAQKLKTQVLQSELEALLVEAELIRTHQPQYNVLLKDDKSTIYLLITKDKFPKIQPIRKRELLKLNPKGTILGPFSSHSKLKEVLKIIRPIFPWCDRGVGQNRPCFYYHINQCPGVCTKEVSAQDYQQIIHHLTQFLKGKKKSVVTDLKDQMRFFSKNKQYEKAGTLRDRLQLIQEVTNPKFRLKPEMILPVLRQTQHQEQVVQLSRLLRNYLDLPAQYLPKRIEGYDVSNTQGKNAAVSMVVFGDGVPDKSQYRLFNIKTINQPNDYGMLQEAIVRRQRHPEWGRPDLVIVDGGKGQVRAASTVWQWRKPLIGIAKNPDRLVIPILGKQANLESKRLKVEYRVLKLASNHPALKLVQQVRDESHRFSKKQHTKRRLKTFLSN